ncbi:MAG: response regulator [Magnetococcales bacterium]|nr:response regulator [Magnetococcales bacterium]
MRDDIFDPKLIIRFERFARFCALVVAAFGISVLISWVLDIPTLKSVLPGLVTMKANTAIGFLLAGLSLLAALRQPMTPGLHGFQLITAAAVLMLGLLTFSEYLFDMDFGIDQLLFVAPYEAIARAPPGRMAEASTVVFTMIGLVLILFNKPRWSVIAQSITLITNLIGLLVILSYFYDVPVLHGAFARSGVALHTAFGFLVINLGMLFAKPKQGLMATISNATASGVTVRRFLPFALMSPIIIGWLRVNGERNGWFDSETGVVIVQLTYVTLFSALIWYFARILGQSEHNRIEAEITRRQQQAQLHESEMRFYSMADAVPVIIWLADPDRNFTWSNQHWMDFTGRSMAQDLGAGWTENVHPDDRACLLDSYCASFKRYIAFEMEHRLLHADGHYHWVLSRGLPRFNENGDFLGLVICCMDITSQKVAEQQMSDARNAAEQANRMKSTFLATMSHEIRTPMNAILGMTQLCLRTNPKPQQQNYLNKIELASDSLLRIIDDILDYSKIEAGRLQIVAEPFRLDDIFEAIVSMLADKAIAKGLFLVVPVGNQSMVTLVGDAMRLGQVLVNLVSNAIKFTEHGQIVIGVAEQNMESELIELHFTVRDEGIGMNAEEQTRLFLPFSQANASTTRRFGGTGLGLAISKRLVDLMDGRIWVESAPGQGSTFHFTVRLSTSDVPVGSRMANNSPSLDQDALDRLRGTNILLVEDNNLNQEVMCDLLAQVGFSVRVATNGLEAITAVESAIPDCVLMDCQMPIMDGFEATRRLRARPEYRKLPIIALTANATATDRELCLVAGMNAFVSKPIRINELLTTLSHLIKPRSGVLPDAVLPADSTFSVAIPGVPAKSPVLPVLPGFDTATGLEFAGRRRDLYVKWLKRFRDDHAMTFMENFQMARTTDDWPTLIRQAHTVKGLAATLGAVTLAEIATQLEMAVKEQQIAQINILETEIDKEFDKIIESLAQLDEVTVPDAAPVDAVYSTESLEPLEHFAHLLRQYDTESTVYLDEFKRAMQGISNTAPQLAAVIHHSGRTLLRVINDILEFSKMQVSRLTLNLLPFNLGMLLDDLNTTFTDQTQRKGLTFNLKMAKEIPLHILGDPYRLNQILFNLLGNALKFTSKGSIGLTVDLLEERETVVLLRFDVIDTGIGISQEFQQHLFEAFSQEDPSISRRFGGSGLGLAITQRLVRMKGGELHVESVPDQGSTFWFMARFNKQPHLEDQCEIASWRTIQQSATPNDIHFEGRILLVEDNLVNQEMAVATLEIFGCQVTVAKNGMQALSTIHHANSPFDVILMDCEMPVLDGFEATRRLREWEKKVERRRTPVVALTAHVLKQSRQLCLDAGMDDYLQKPFSHTDLAAKLHRWLPRINDDTTQKKQTDPAQDLALIDPDPVLSPSNPAIDNAALPVPILDPVAVSRILGLTSRSSTGLLGKMVQHYLIQTPQLLANLEQAIEQNDSEEVRVTAHTLKSSSLTMGVTRLAELGRAMETNHANLELVRHHFRLCDPTLAEARQALHNLLSIQQEVDV